MAAKIAIERKWPDTDPDLMSASCMGIGLQFPHLWEIVKRYILRGDNYFQNGGLTTLAANIWSMPLEEATDVLEQYYQQHNYFPPAAGQRGGVNLAALQAVHAVATAPDFSDDGSKSGRRKRRLLDLLERHRSEVRRHLQLPEGLPAGTRDYMAGDRAAVDETIAAVRAEGSWDVKLDPQSGQTEAQKSIGARGGTVAASEPADDERQPTPEPAQTNVSPTDLIKAKYGYDQLDQRISFIEGRIGDRVDGLEKNIDRFIAQKQVDVGSRQVKVGLWGVAIAIIAILGTIIVPVLLKSWGLTL